MKLYIFRATVEIKAKNKDDAQIELVNLMDKHNICWDEKWAEPDWEEEDG